MPSTTRGPEILALRKLGLSYPAIAERLGLSENTVGNVVRAHNGLTPAERRARDAAILGKRAGGTPLSRIAAALNVPAETVFRVCQRGKVDLSPEDIQRRNQTIVDLRKEGASLHAIASRMGLSTTWVSSILRSAGLSGGRKRGRDREIVRLALAGYTMKQISELQGISSNAAGKAFERAGGAQARRNSRNTLVAQAMDLLRVGMSQAEIGKRVGVSPAAVSRMLKR